MSDSLRDQLQTSLGAAYIIERELDGGGMSRVFVAEETRFHRRVVIKVLSPELAAGLSAERFEREIALAAGLQQANVVPVITAGEVGGLPWYTMPYVDGESLRARLAGDSSAPIPTGEAVHVLRDVAKALAYAHARGIVHRDIKPENVLLSGGTAVVTDFGIAKALAASKTHAPGGTLTSIGMSLGTPAYMAPEQVVGDDVDHRADVYAWGVMAYEMLAGRHPFAGKTGAQQLIAAHIAEIPAPLDARRLGVPDALACLVMRCLEKQAVQRPASATELLASLDDVRTGEQNAVLRGSPRTRLVAAVAVGLVILGGAAALVARVRTDRPADAPTIAVLPFENHGPAEHALFAEGLTDAVTGKLVGVSGLTVIERGSVTAYRATTKTHSEIGAELGVAYLLKGVVRWAQDGAGQWRAQVTPTLVRTRDGVAQWAGDPVIVTPTDPFTAQAEIAARVVSAIGVTIGARERASLAKAPTKNAEAYELYVRARTLFRDPARRVAGSADMVEAARLLERATQIDPSFAVAFALLARVEYELTVTDPTATRRYESALRSALALDPELAEAHFARAEYLWFRVSRFTESAAAFARASTLKPGDAEFLSQYAAVQVVTGETSGGFADFERTIVLDPRDPTANSRVAFFCWHFRRFDDAARHAERMLAIARDDWAGHGFLVQIALARGDTAAARIALTNAERGTGHGNANAGLFWMLPLSLTGSRDPSAGGIQIPALTAGTDSLLHYTVLGAWARETGQRDRARPWFDSALAVARAPRYALASRRIHMSGLAGLQAIALAGTGRVAEARRAIAIADSIERTTALPNEPNIAAAQDYLAYALLLLGDRDAAIAKLERLLALPSGRTPAMLRTMWPYASLRGDARFQRLAEAGR